MYASTLLITLLTTKRTGRNCDKNVKNTWYDYGRNRRIWWWSNVKAFHLIAPDTYLDAKGRLFQKTASGTMEKVETKQTAAEDRYVARHMKGAKS